MSPADKLRFEAGFMAGARAWLHGVPRSQNPAGATDEQDFLDFREPYAAGWLIGWDDSNDAEGRDD